MHHFFKKVSSLSSGAPIMHLLFLLKAPLGSHFLLGFHSLFSVILWLDNFKGPIFYFTDLFYLIHSATDAFYGILQLQNSFVIFYDFSLLVEFLILSVSCFSDFIELCFCAFLQLIELLKMIFWILYQMNHRSPCLWGWFLENDCVSFLMPCFLGFSGSCMSFIAVFASEVAVSSFRL